MPVSIVADMWRLETAKNGLKPEIMPGILNQNPAQFLQFRMLMTLLYGQAPKHVIGRATVDTYEKGLVIPPFVVQTPVVAAGAGNDVTMVITNTNAAGTATEARLGQTVYHPVTGEEARITNIVIGGVGVVTLTLEPKSTAVDWAAGGLATGKIIPIGGFNKPERSNKVATMIGDLSNYTWGQTELRETIEFSGRVPVQGLHWVAGADGGPGQVYHLDMQDTLDRARDFEDREALFGMPDGSNYNLNNPGYTVLQNCGVIPAIRGKHVFAANPNGHPGGQIIGTGGTVQLSHFEGITRAMNNLMTGDREYMMLYDQNFQYSFQDLIKTQGGVIDAWKVVAVDKGEYKGVDLTFNYLKHGDMTFYGKSMPAFNSSNSFGQVGGLYDNFCIGIPKAKMFDSVTGGMEAPVTLFNNGPSRKRVWVQGSLTDMMYGSSGPSAEAIKTAGAIPVGTTDVDEIEYNILCQSGAMYRGLQRFFIMQR